MTPYRRRRFFVPSEQIRDGVAFLPPDQAHHLRTVLRLKAGDSVEIFDGEGSGYSGRIEDRDADTVVVLLEKLTARQSSVWTALAPALIKADRFEWMLEKATELGVDEIRPLETRFADIRIPGTRLEARLERWRRIVRESSKQCRRLSIPIIHAPIPLRELSSLNEPRFTAKLFLHERAASPWVARHQAADRILVCTGPEGGWSEREVEEARQAGFDIIHLGPRILRAETAAIAALTIIQFAAESAQH